MKHNLLEVSLSQTSHCNPQVTSAFIALFKGGKVEKSAVAKIADWNVSNFTCEGYSFTAAYSELQESVRILSMREGEGRVCNVLNSTTAFLEVWFTVWAQGVVKGEG